AQPLNVRALNRLSSGQFRTTVTGVLVKPRSMSAYESCTVSTSEANRNEARSLNRTADISLDRPSNLDENSSEVRSCTSSRTGRRMTFCNEAQKTSASGIECAWTTSNRRGARANRAEE